MLSTSCFLLHVPYTLRNETKLSEEHRNYFAFTKEKLVELRGLKATLPDKAPEAYAEYLENKSLFVGDRTAANPTVQNKVHALSEQDFVREPSFYEREEIQKKESGPPLLPTTIIGSFLQTAEVKVNRANLKSGKISLEQYRTFNREKITECVALQEKVGLDVLVHGEFERNDMAEYFGECPDSFLFTGKAWVQSYGTRCVKPPTIWGDVSRGKPITVERPVYAQSLTAKSMKGMLTGPVIILSWSFPREDTSLKECTHQIGLAIHEEVLGLEANHIHVIQVDEAALREKLLLRKSDWRADHPDWTIPAFRLVHSGVKPETRIHMHMCYNEFADIIRDTDAMDADAITFEASHSDLTILSVLKENGFCTGVGPGVYDIHSPRVPLVDEIKAALRKMLGSVPKEKLWVNPDCGLKTRSNTETIPSLEHLVQAAKEVRDENSWFT